MYIENIGESKSKQGGKSELGASEKLIFSQQNGRYIINDLLELNVKQQGVLTLKEFTAQGSKAETTNGLAISLNKAFIELQLSLKASGKEGLVVVRKTAKFDISNYNKADMKKFGSNHIATIRDAYQKIVEESQSENEETLYEEYSSDKYEIFL